MQALDKTFENECFNILRIQHPNIIRLVGYCYETQRKHVMYNGELRFSDHIYRILCFELMQGGSLDKYLNGKIRKVQVISFLFTKDQFLNFKLESYSFVLPMLKNLVTMTGQHVTI